MLLFESSALLFSVFPCMPASRLVLFSCPHQCPVLVLVLVLSLRCVARLVRTSRIYYLNAYVLYSVAYESRTSLELECCSHETGERPLARSVANVQHMEANDGVKQGWTELFRMCSLSHLLGFYSLSLQL